MYFDIFKKNNLSIFFFLINLNLFIETIFNYKKYLTNNNLGIFFKTSSIKYFIRIYRKL